MDKRIKIIAVAILLPISVVVPALLAQTMAMDSQVYAQQSTLQQRVEEYKAKLGTAPSQADLNKLKLRCGVAQTVLKNLQTRTESVSETRTSVYKTIDDSLVSLQTALKAKSIDTAKLDTEIVELKTKSTQFTTDMTAYKQAVADSASLDCATDALGLKASLQEARLLHDKLVVEVADIRTYVINTVKPTLAQVKTDLQAQAAAAATQTTTPGGTTDAAQ